MLPWNLFPPTPVKLVLLVCPVPVAVTVAAFACMLSTIHEFAAVVVTAVVGVVEVENSEVALAPIGDARVPVREIAKALTFDKFAVHTALLAPVAGEARTLMSIQVFWEVFLSVMTCVRATAL